MATIVTKSSYYKPLQFVADKQANEFIFTGIWVDEKAVIFLYKKKTGKFNLNIDADGNCFELRGKQYIPISRDQALSALQPKGFKLVYSGTTASVITATGREIAVQYAIANAEDLISSHDINLNPDNRYPKELQPRDRTRAASETQVAKIVNQLRPEFLGASIEASRGAPIIGSDGFVESGNARTIALKRIYRENSARAKSYKAYLIARAESLGFKQSLVENIPQPILVRLRTTELDRVKFCAEANQSEVARLSPVEQAISDARLMTEGLMKIFYPTEDGNILTAANREWFIPQFMEKIIGSESAAYLDPDGLLNVDGLRRIKNAVFAKAYGDSPEGNAVLQRVVEDTSNNFNNIANALLKQAGRFAQLKADIQAGNKYNLDISGDIVVAARKLSDLRASSTRVIDYLNQYNLFGERLSPLQKQILIMFDENSRSSKRINDVLDRYLVAAEKSSNPNQSSFMEDCLPNKEILFSQAAKSEEYGLFQAA